MANPLSPQGHDQPGSDKAQEHQHAPHSEGHDYDDHETEMIETVSIKTWHDQSAHIDSERPVSAGTLDGTEFDFDKLSAADEDILAKNIANPVTIYAQTPRSPESTVVRDHFTKPQVSDGLDTDEAFQFGKPNPQQTQFNITRPPPASNRQMKGSVGEHVERDRGAPPAEMEGAGGMQTSFHDSPPDFPTKDTVAERSTPPLASERQRKKKKQKIQPRGQLMLEALNEVSADSAMARPFDAIASAAGAAADHEVDVQPASFRTDETHAAQDHRPARMEPNRESSPHEQLQGDLDTAAQDQHNHIHESSTTLARGSPDNAGADIQSIDEQQYSLPDNEAEIDNQQATHASGPVAPMRVHKKSKSSRKRNSARAQAADSNEWKLADYGKLFILKVQEHEEREQAREAAFASEREALQVELQQWADSHTAIQSNLSSMLSENGQLTVTVGQQKSKIASYETKFHSFKRFVDGVGKDIDAIRKDANTLRRRSDDITTGLADIRQSARFDKINSHVDVCQKIKREAVNLAREKDEELHRTVLHRDQLQQQLSDTIGLLSEHRDRCAKLERQLQESEKKLVDSMNVNQKNHSAMLDKLHLIHTAVDDEQSKGNATSMIERLRVAVGAISSPAESAVQDIAGVKALVEALDEKLNSNIKTTEATEVSIREYFDVALKAVASQMSDREKLVEDHRNVISGLQEQLSASNNRTASEEAQKTAAIEQVGAISQRNAALQSKVSALENTKLQLSETKLELEKIVTMLGSTNVDLESRAEQVKTLTQANNSLGDQVKALQDRLRDTQRNDESTPMQMKEAEERTKEMAMRIEKFEIELQTKSQNELKKVNSEKNRLEKMIKPLQDEVASYQQQMNATQAAEVASYKQHIDATKAERPASTVALKQELQRIRKQCETQTNELESLQSTVKSLEEAAIDGKALQVKLLTLSVQLDADQANLRRTTERNLELQEQVKQLQDAREVEERDSRVAMLQKDLDEAKDNANRSNAGLEAFKKSCDDAVKAANTNNERRLQALQKQLSETQAELQTARTDSETFFEGVEQSWKDEQEVWRKNVAEANEKTEAVEASKAASLLTCESTIQQLRIELAQQRNTMQEENEILSAQLRAAKEQSQAPILDHTQGSFSSLVYDEDDGVNESQPPPPEIPETQLEDSLPTFTAFNSSPHDNRQSERSEVHSAHSSSNPLAQPWSEEEKKKYTYHPPVPQSNSASKRVPSHPMQRRKSGTESRVDRSKTPNLDTQSSNEFRKRMPSNSSSSSSPAFMKANTNPRFTTYSTPGNAGGQQRLSQTESQLIQDPRLVGREQAAGVKRKPTGPTIDGYEQERKRRLSTNSGTNELERGTQSQVPQSINDLPSSFRGTTRRSSQTHMQTFGGGNSRTTRRTARGQGAGEMRARFAQELQRRR